MRSLIRLAFRVFAAGAGLIVLVALVVQFRAREELPAVPAPGDLRVVTYNIRAGLSGVDKVEKELRALSPDVVTLQEVERNIARSLRVDQAATLGAGLEMDHAFAGAIRIPGDGEHGVAILSRWPLREVEIVDLPRGRGRWRRVALKARVEAPVPFRVVCVHFARPWGWPLSNMRTRLGQIEELLADLEGDDLPVVVAGDFNAFPLSPEGWKLTRRLESSWKPWRDGWATSFPLTTIGWPFGSVKIDHVYHDPAWKSRGTWVGPPGASDHRPVIVDLVAPGEAP